jgi:hypothetical protein
MAIQTVVGDLSHFEVKRLDQVENGEYFLRDGELGRRVEINEHPLWLLFSGERSLLLVDFAPREMVRGHDPVLALRDGLTLRVEPLGPLIRSTRVAAPAGQLLISASSLGVGASLVSDADAGNDAGRVLVGIVNNSTEFHNGGYAWAVQHWAFRWIDATGATVLSLQSEPS